MLGPTSRAAACRCSAGKGFGTPSASPRRKAGGGKAPTPQQVADEALAEARRSSPKVRPVDPREAARGKVDYVQIKDWAGGNAADIGDLQVVPGSAGTGYGAGPAARAGGDAGDAAGPFFKQLGHHAQYLERQGVLSIASGPGRQPYLPFEAWQYSRAAYCQYLAEVAAVHAAMEGSLEHALARRDARGASQQQQEGSSSSSSSGGGGLAAAGGQAQQAVRAYEALAMFGASCGLWRAAAAQADLQALAAGAPDGAAARGGTQVQHGAQAQAPRASQNAVAYGRYLAQLARAAAVDGAQDGGDGHAAALKLVAHAYALQVQQCLLGSRIGAAATDKLRLLAVPAVALYMQYPEHVREPEQDLVRITDAAGELLGPAGRQAVLDELPKALQKSALMLAPLASPA